MNIFEGYNKKQLHAVKEVLKNFYYGKDLKSKSIRKFYKSVLKICKKDLKKAYKCLEKNGCNLY